MTPLRIARFIEWGVVLLTVPVSALFIHTWGEEAIFMAGIAFGMMYADARRFRRWLQGGFE